MRIQKSHTVPDVSRYSEQVLEIIREMQSKPARDGEQLGTIRRRHVHDSGEIFSNNLLVRTAGQPS